MLTCLTSIGEFSKYVKWNILDCFTGLQWCHIPAGKNAQNTSAEKDHNLIDGFISMFICVFLKGWAHHQICHQVQYLASLLETPESICQKIRQMPCQTSKNTKVKSILYMSCLYYMKRFSFSLCFCFHLLSSSMDCLSLFSSRFWFKVFPISRAPGRTETVWKLHGF